eukprot:SAG22_NODE_1197_length_5195_cov_2.344388_2_plen_255_part_00
MCHHRPQLTFGIMCVTILTATIDISTPYTAASPLIKVALLAGACIQLTSRLLVFGAVLSMEQAGKKTTAGIVAVIAYFVGSTLLTLVIHLLCVKMKLYHRGDAAYRQRTETAHYKITLKTSAEKGAGTTSCVTVTLYGEDGSQTLQLGGAGRRIAGTDSHYSFEPGSTRTFPFECEELGKLSSVEVGHDDSGDSSDWKCDYILVVHQVNQQQWRFAVGRWISQEAGLLHSIPAPSAAGETVDGKNSTDDAYMPL